MRYIFFLLFFCFQCICIYGQDIELQIKNNLSDDINKEIREKLSITSINDLSGTYWVIDDAETEHSISKAYIFLEGNIVIEITIISQRISPSILSNISPSNSIRNNLYYIASVDCAVKYTVRNNEIIIFDKLSCYLKDGSLYFGDKSYGFLKYKLLSTFFQNFNID